jgi:hypothetical protein
VIVTRLLVPTEMIPTIITRMASPSPKEFLRTRETATIQ